MAAELKQEKASEKITVNVSGENQAIKTGAAEGEQAVGSDILEEFDRFMDAFVGRFLAREGESVAEAKVRLTANENTAVKFSFPAAF